jgi:uncharacterized protein (TIGR02996 family)
MTDREAFLAGIAENPDDDLRRLVYADWLDDHGHHVDAEFIRLSIEFESATKADGSRKYKLLRRIRELLPSLPQSLPHQVSGYEFPKEPLDGSDTSFTVCFGTGKNWSTKIDNEGRRRWVDYEFDVAYRRGMPESVSVHREGMWAGGCRRCAYYDVSKHQQRSCNDHPDGKPPPLGPLLVLAMPTVSLATQNGIHPYTPTTDRAGRPFPWWRVVVESPFGGGGHIPQCVGVWMNDDIPPDKGFWSHDMTTQYWRTEDDAVRSISNGLLRWARGVTP